MKFIKRYNELGIDKGPLVGGKNAFIAEVKKLKIKTPDGFVITVHGFNHFEEKNHLTKEIENILSTLNLKNIKNLEEKGELIRQLIMNAKFPEDLYHEIILAYQKLENDNFKSCDVAVRSSVTVNDLPDENFEELQETYFNVRGHHFLIDACKKCFASLFTNRALTYIKTNKIKVGEVKISIGVQRMVRSDIASSGFLYTIDNETGFKNTIHISSLFGICDKSVLDFIDPDEFYVFKPTVNYPNPIISKKLGDKHLKMAYDVQGTKKTKIIHVDINEQVQFSIDEKDVISLSRTAVKIEKHFSSRYKKEMPLKIEWAKDGETGEIVILEVQPERIHSKKDMNNLIKFQIKETGRILSIGKPVGHMIGHGRAHVIKDIKHTTFFRKGHVLVTNMTDPDWEPVMKLASAIVINKGGSTCHCALFSKEQGIPCIVSSKNSTKVIHSGQNITIDCTGDKGIVYDGLLQYNEHIIDINKVPKTKTKIMMNISSRAQALKYSFIPNDGVGLARTEFIINSDIKVHPKALFDFDNIDDIELKTQIEEITVGYKDKKEFFVDKLSYGIAMIASAFYPKDVIVRLSDFHTNEYINLIGGKRYEFGEENPMIGFRGASRYYNPLYKGAFRLECLAMKKVIEEMGLRNIKILVPFCRTPAEGIKIKNLLKKNGLKNVPVHVMCEIPSNALLAEKFLKIFDGMSIGSNDLTQLTLGLDRDNKLISGLYDENDESVKKMIRMVVDAGKKLRKEIGFCGDAPSSIPGFTEFLVGLGIDSISLTPDTMISAKIHVSRAEKRIKK